MTIVNPTGVIRKYVDGKVSAEETARKNADSSLQTAVNGKVPTSRKVNGHALTADVTVTKSDVGLGNTDNGAKAPSTDATLASTTNPPTAKVVKDYVDGKLSGDLGTAAYKDVGTSAGNIPVLDSAGKLVASVIPELAISRYLGASDTKANLSKLTGGQIGDWATVTSDPTEANNGAYMLTATTGLEGTWTQISGPTPLVWGKIGGTLSAQSDLQTALDAKQAKLTAGTGISIASNGTIGLKNTVTAGTVGSATVIPKLTYNAQGQITKAESVTIYPPTTAGTSGQVWRSDGGGAGAWDTPSSKSDATSAGETALATIGAVKTLAQTYISSFSHIKMMVVKGESAFVKGDNTVEFTAPSASATGDVLAYGDDLQAHVADDATVIICSPTTESEDAWVSTGISITGLTYSTTNSKYTATFNASVANTSKLAFTLQCTTYL